MADAAHLAKLLEGVAAWNQWREANPEIKPDLAGVDLTDHALRSTVLYERDEKGHSKINLQAANLKDANLCGAKLQGVGFELANLQRADLGLANLQGAELLGANLKEAKLFLANLKGAMLWIASLQGADLRRANLQDADVTAVLFDRSSRQRNFRGIRVSACHGSQLFKSFAQDQDYIEDLRGSGRWGEVKFWLWWLLANCGRSFIRWALWSLGLAVLFGIVYYGMGTAHIKPDPPLPFSPITMIYYSVVTFTTLGFGDVKPQTELAAIIVMVEVIIGYVMLGGLVSILANKLARRA
jgi:hypothetical protein